MEKESAQPSSLEDLIEWVRSSDPVIPRGGGTKPALWTTHEPRRLVDMRNISGIVEYQPSEYVITVKSGTTLREVQETLRKNGQYLPFDPPLVKRGATIGGSVAAGLSGPGAYRYGPLKDFIIGVRFVDGLGNQIRGGGKVVKNAAGFDFPKLFNGSMGRLGIMTELSFKVFPEPKAYATLTAQVGSVEEGCNLMAGLKGFDIEGLELDADLTLYLRLGYQEATMKVRQQALESLTGQTMTLIEGEEEPETWEAFKQFSSLDSFSCLIKVATHLRSLQEILARIEPDPWKFHISNGGKALYLGTSNAESIFNLDTELAKLNVTGVLLKGPPGQFPLIGNTKSLRFVRKIQQALDPNGVFQNIQPEKSLTAR